MPSLPSTPSTPKSVKDAYGSVSNGAKDLYQDAQKVHENGNGYHDKATSAYERADHLYDRAENGYGRAKEIYEDKDQLLERAGDLYENREKALQNGKDAWKKIKDGDFEGALDEIEAGLGLDEVGLVGVDSDGFCDECHAEEAPTEEEDAAEAVAMSDIETDADATAGLRVCRNLVNTIDTRAVGYAWFSA